MKYCGMIGFSDTVEVTPGEWVPQITEKKYRGDILNSTWRSNTSDKVNDDLTISNRISIISNPYAYNHLANIVYAVWAGTKWKVTSVEVQTPRLILTIGGEWNDGQSEIETP